MWAIGGILIPVLFWDFFVTIDKGLGHPFRTWAGFGHQMKFFIVLCSIVGLIAFFREYSIYEEGRVEREAASRRQAEANQRANEYKAFKMEEDAMWEKEIKEELAKVATDPTAKKNKDDWITLFGEVPSPFAKKDNPQ